MWDVVYNVLFFVWDLFLLGLRAGFWVIVFGGFMLVGYGIVAILKWLNLTAFLDRFNISEYGIYAFFFGWLGLGFYAWFRCSCRGCEEKSWCWLLGHPF